MTLPLLKACNGRLAHKKGEYPFSGLHVIFAVKKQTTELSSVLTVKRLQGTDGKEKLLSFSYGRSAFCRAH